MNDWDFYNEWDVRPSTWVERAWCWLKSKIRRRPMRILIRDYYQKREYEIELVRGTQNGGAETLDS